MENNNQSKSIYDFMKEAGVELPQLVDAGLELLAGVEKDEELELRLENKSKSLRRYKCSSSDYGWNSCRGRFTSAPN